MLPIGATTVQWTATDAAGNRTAIVPQTITVNESDTAAACCGTKTPVLGNGWPNVFVQLFPFEYCVFGFGSIDTIVGGLAPDFMSGGDGLDTITIGASGSTLVGRAGDDVLIVPLGTASLYGGAGNDVMDNNFGGIIYGGTGDDVIVGVLGTHQI